MNSIFDGISVPALSQPAVSTVPAAGQSAAGFSGIVAAVSPAEMEDLVRDACDAVVLRAPVRTAGSTNRHAEPGTYRYVFPCAGIVFVTTSVRSLDLGNEARLIPCQFILHQGFPLTGKDGR